MQDNDETQKPAEDKAQKSPQPDAKLQGLSILLELEHKARLAKTEKELNFLIVNETYSLIDYRQAAIFSVSSDKTPNVETISGIATVDNDAPFVVWLKKIAKHNIKHFKENEVTSLTANDVEKELREQWSEWSAPYALWCPLTSPDGEVIGYLWMSSDSKWHEAHFSLAQRLAEAYAFTLDSLAHRKKTLIDKIFKKPKALTLGIIFAIVGAMLFPVNNTVLAPMEIAPIKPWIATSPQKGVIKEIYIEPNQKVEKGDLLFSLDDTEIRNEQNLATKTLEVTIAELRQANQQAIMADKEKAAKVALLELEVQKKINKIIYTEELLDRIHVKADRSGIAIYSAKDDWIGRPIEVGQKVMTVADPHNVEIRAFLSVEDAIDLPKNALIKVFLHTDPLADIEGFVTNVSYEATKAESNTLSYRVTGTLEEGTEKPRVGLKGTAKIYGNRVTFFYYLFRKPITVVQQWLGL